MRGRGSFALTVLLLALLAGPSAASASPTQASVFMDDNLLLYRGDDVADRTLSELSGLGVDVVRVSVHWRTLAPGRSSGRKPARMADATDPAHYDAAIFDKYDHLVRAAHQYGIEVLFNVTGLAPLWATGTSNGRHVGPAYRPDPFAFGDFVRMLGRRYSGTYEDENQGQGPLPRVSIWSIWNEPNQGAYLQPQWIRTPAGRWLPQSPRLYRALVRRALAGLAAAGHGEDTVLLGETAPLGSDRRGRTRAVRPVTFLASLFCLDPVRLRPLKRRAARDAGCDYRGAGGLAVTGYAHHPYSIIAPPDYSDPNRLNIRLGDANRLERLLDAAGAAHRIPVGLPVWWTEYGWQTNPPDPTKRGIALDRQAVYIAQAEHLTWADTRTVALAQFLLRDDDPVPGLSASDPRRWNTYQSGLEFADGTPKPAFDAYRLPFVAPVDAKPGQQITLWGMVRPGAEGTRQTIQLQFAPEGSNTFGDDGNEVAVLDPRGYFETTVTAQESGNWRFTWSPGSGSVPRPSGIFAPPGGAVQPPVYASVPATVHVGR
jgi:hypothetical protein